MPEKNEDTENRICRFEYSFEKREKILEKKKNDWLLEIPKKNLPTLHPYQKKAVEFFKKHPCCCLIMPTGTGKTVTACKIIAEKKTTVLVVVPTLDLQKTYTTFRD